MAAVVVAEEVVPVVVAPVEAPSRHLRPGQILAGSTLQAEVCAFPAD